MIYFHYNISFYYNIIPINIRINITSPNIITTSRKGGLILLLNISTKSIMNDDISATIISKAILILLNISIIY